MRFSARPTLGGALTGREQEEGDKEEEKERRREGGDRV